MALVLGYADERRRWPWLSRRRSQQCAVAMVLLIVVTFVAADLGMFDGGGERECFVWPTIDTQFAKGYSESAFNSIRIGMPREQVDRIMCAPLGVNEVNAYVVYRYTSDGGAPWGDFAWHLRDVVFKDGVVTAVDRRVAGD